MTASQDIKKITKTVEEALHNHRNHAGALLPILHEIQAQLRHIPHEAVGMIAEDLNLSRAEVHGVVTFYHSFSSEPLGQQVVEVCRAESCQAMGGRALEREFKKELGIEFGQTTADGAISLEPVYCLGNCGCSPAVRVGNKLYGRVSRDTAKSLIAQLKREQQFEGEQQ